MNKRMPPARYFKKTLRGRTRDEKIGWIAAAQAAVHVRRGASLEIAIFRVHKCLQEAFATKWEQAAIEGHVKPMDVLGKQTWVTDETGMFLLALEADGIPYETQKDQAWISEIVDCAIRQEYDKNQLKPTNQKEFEE